MSGRRDGAGGPPERDAGVGDPSTEPPATLVRSIGRLFVGDGTVVEDGALLAIGGRIAWVGSDAQGPPGRLATRPVEEVDAGGALVTPGLIDAHTHPVYAGQRFAEIAARAAGRSYEEVGQRGGIGATVHATRAAPPDELEAAVDARLDAWLRSGTTTVEAKTGYHLTRDGELAAVRLLRERAEDPTRPRVHVTFLAAHAVAPEYADADAYVEEAASWSAEAALAGARSVDVFCDAGYFTVEQARRVLRAGRDAGLTQRIHADELQRTGGARLAAELGCRSADHLLRITGDDAAALAAADVVATLCPTTALAMGATPDVDALRDAGVTIALGTDHNPGTSGTTDMSLVVGLAVSVLGLRVEEALVAAARGGARSLGVTDRGVLRPGMLADLVIWPAPHEGAFAWGWGLVPERVLLGGQSVELSPSSPRAPAR